jgi:hypothetical protein
MFYWNKIQNNKTTKQIYDISKTKFVVFYYKIFIVPPTLSQNCVSKNSPFWIVWDHITMIQKQQKLKIQTNNVPWSIPIQMPCSSKPCTHPTPLTTFNKIDINFHEYAPISFARLNPTFNLIHYVYLMLTNFNMS